MANLKTCLLFLTGILLYAISNAQGRCSALGQNPGTAFPICGTQSFEQSQVPQCGDKPIPGPCSGEGLTDKNPYWYKFTCYESGTLGLLITPHNLADDYDWQIFDITTAQPNEVYTNPDLFVAGNWSGEPGKTGASDAGNTVSICAGFGKPLFSSRPALVKDHQYLLLISHFDGSSQSGYSLDFGGGSAVITDPKDPLLQSASANCDAMEVRVVLNKKMKCESLAADGSDFRISTTLSLITGARSVSCNNSFDMDSVILMLDKPLMPGHYTVSAKNGHDANTLVDNCSRTIPTDDKVDLEILPVQPIRMDSIVPVKCAPLSIKLLFKKVIRCNSISPDGSDFIVTGPSAVSIVSASGTCNTEGNTPTVEVIFSTPLINKGVYTIQLKTGNDGNTLIDECGQEVISSALNFSILPPVSANFSYQLFPGCRADSIWFSHNGLNDVNKWTWNFDGTDIRTTQNPQKIYYTTGDKKIQLIVSNGFCSDTTSKDISLEPKIKAMFDSPYLICAIDKANYEDKSSGDIVNWDWDFGNNSSSTRRTPESVSYPVMNNEKKYQVSLAITARNGCKDTAVKQIIVVGNCFIAVPSAFTPNNDGLNDFLYPSNAYKSQNLEFKVYNRFGMMVFQTKDWTNKWDGTFKGQPQKSDTYVWTLTYTNKDTGKKFFLKGATVLIR